MATSELVPATEAHARAMAPRMRESDVREVQASCGYAPLQALLDALAVSSWARALLFDGEVAALVGVAPTGHALIGSAWLLGTEAIREHKREFLGLCRPTLEEMLELCPVLCNYVDARNEVSLRWLARLGAVLGAPEPYGAEGLPFVPFLLRRS